MIVVIIIIIVVSGCYVQYLCVNPCQSLIVYSASNPNLQDIGIRKIWNVACYENCGQGVVTPGQPMCK